MAEENKHLDHFVKKALQNDEVPTSSFDWTEKVMSSIEVKPVTVASAPNFSKSFYFGAAVFFATVIVSSILYWSNDSLTSIGSNNFTLQEISFPSVELPTLWLYCGLSFFAFFLLIVYRLSAISKSK